MRSVSESIKRQAKLVILCLQVISHLTQGLCSDNGGAADCAAWAAAGECAHNPPYMYAQCAASCQSTCLCPQYAPSGRSPDTNCFCPYWASQGLCVTSPTYMNAACQSSCSVVQSLSCGTPPDVLNTDKTFTSTAWTANVTYACSYGHDLTSGAKGLRFCLQNGTWARLWYGDGVDPVCTPWLCPAPTPVQDATISLDNPAHTFGAKATYTCTAGMEVSSGDSVLTCGNKSWTGTLPNCTVFTCGDPPTVAGATYETNGTKYRDVATYACAEKDARMTGSPSISCTASRSWQPPPTCTQTAGMNPLVVYVTVPLLLLLAAGIVVLVYYIFIFIKLRRTPSRSLTRMNGSQVSLITPL